MTRSLLRRDVVGLLAVALCWGALLAYRAWNVEPREWAALCAAAAPPLACLPRAGLLWLQQQGLWGGGALVLGLAAFAGAPFWSAVAAVAVGIAGVVNYNATYGMVGVALGGWAWIGSARHASNTDRRPTDAHP